MESGIKEEKKTQMKETKKISMFILFTLFGNMMFFIGFHGVDLCRNELNIEHDINNYMENHGYLDRFSISETTGWGVEMGLSRCHVVSATIMLISFVFSILSAFFLGGYLKWA